MFGSLCFPPETLNVFVCPRVRSAAALRPACYAHPPRCEKGAAIQTVDGVWGSQSKKSLKQNILIAV